MTRRMDDAGVAAVIGAIVVLAVLGVALLYVNAFHVPRQGAGLELAAAERAETSLTSLAALLAAGNTGGPFAHDVPLRADRAAPPLLAGVVSSPVRADGRLALDTPTSNLTISLLTAVPAEGIPAGDATRVAESGKMRVYVLGSATKGAPLGTLRATTGGAYVASADRVLEGGAVIADTRDGSASIAPPAITLAQDAGRARLTWRVPLLAGSTSEVSGASSATATFVPGPESKLGGGQAVDEVRIRVETPRLAAWRAAMTQLVGASGTVTVTNGATADTGFVDVVVPTAKLDLYVVRYQVSLAERAG